MPGELLLDTCALIWLANGDPIEESAAGAVARAEERGELNLSPISAWEVATLAAKGRIRLTVTPEAWIDRIAKETAIRFVDLSAGTLIRSASLPGTPPSDPADRMIIATARDHGFSIVTRDRLILDYAREGWVRAVPC